MENGGPGHDVDGIQQGVDNVLGSAEIGLILTRSQGGTQTIWLTQTGQTNRVFNTMGHHAWV